jgi:hypothetical protein
MTRARIVVSVLAAALALPVSAAAQIDSVTHWNTIIVNATQVGRAGPHSLLDIALAQAAVHDAVQVIDGKYRPYAYSAPANPSASRAAAVAAAAHKLLVLLYPGQQGSLDTAYNTYVATNGLAGDPGLAIGEAAAQTLYDDHYRPILPVAQPPATTGVGEWRTAGNFGFYYMSKSTPFTLNRIDQFRPEPPPPMTSTRYLRDYDEVALIGDKTHHDNPDTDRARFWSGNFVVQWNESARQLAETHVPDTGERARLFALLNLAAADAALAVWDSKAFYNFWRPVTAIAEGDIDPNHKTKAIAGWEPLIGTPPYPDYVSGANGLTGAFTGMLRLFFDTDSMTFTVKNPATNIIDKERDYTSFSQAAQEVVDARVLLGIHFRFADEEARRLGERVAHWAFQKFLRPVPGQ